MNNITIRKATPIDYDAIKNLMLIALKEDPTAFSVNLNEYADNSDDWWNSYITPYIFSIKDKLFLAFDENQVVGMIGIVYEYKERRKHVSSIVWFYIKSEYRGRGLSSELLQSAINDATKEGVRKISLLVNNTQEKAIHIYKKFGFAESGRMVKDLKVGDEYLDTLIMEKMLD